MIESLSSLFSRASYYLNGDGVPYELPFTAGTWRNEAVFDRLASKAIHQECVVWVSPGLNQKEDGSKAGRA